VENLTNISEPPVPSNEQKLDKYNFHQFIQVSIGVEQFLPLKLNKQYMENLIQ